MRQLVAYTGFLTPCLLIPLPLILHTEIKCLLGPCLLARQWQCPLGPAAFYSWGSAVLLHCLVLSSAARDDCTHSQGLAGSDQAMLGDLGQVLLRASDMPMPDGEHSSLSQVTTCAFELPPQRRPAASLYPQGILLFAAPQCRLLWDRGINPEPFLCSKAHTQPDQSPWATARSLSKYRQFCTRFYQRELQLTQPTSISLQHSHHNSRNCFVGALSPPFLFCETNLTPKQAPRLFQVTHT